MCTRVLWNDNKLTVIVGRSVDWPESTQPILTVFPRGMHRDGSRLGSEVVVKENAFKWVSKYGSMITSGYGMGPNDGFNEKGVGIHTLYLGASDYGQRDASKPGLQIALWPQCVLDNAATVEEALALLETIQPVTFQLPNGKGATFHLAIDDARGDSAIVEYIKGKMVIHHGRQYQIMTNDPTYDEQLALLKKQDFSKPSMDMPLPGNVNAVDRFQRAAYYKAVLPEPKNEREAVAGVLAIMRNVSVPFGAPYHGFGIYNTEYRTAINLPNKRYFFELTDQPNVIWMDLSMFDLNEGAPVMILDPHDPELSGNVTGKFQKAEKVPF